MSEITASLSQVLRNIKDSIQGIYIDLFDFPDQDVSCALAITEIKKAQRTGGYFKVNISLAIECRISAAIKNREIISLEVAADILSQIEDSTFNCTGLAPKNEMALPYGYDDKFAAWIVTWDQEFWVKKLNYEL